MTLLRITNTPRDYAWGSVDLIPDLLGVEPDGKPQAEIWFGTHPGSPSMTSTGESLADKTEPLGFLAKFLAAAKPLSIQAHPSRQHAAQRFAAGHPGYSDPNHKPELIAAVTPFRALCGFRPSTQTAELLAALAESDESFRPWQTAFASGGYRAATQWALTQSGEVADRLVGLAAAIPDSAELLRSIHEHFPSDPGLLMALLMNFVELAPGEALYLPAGNIHAYLSGLGVEVMAASDNVLRGGLTPKQIDIPELMEVLDFFELENPKANQKLLIAGLVEYQTDCDDFKVYRVEPSSSNLLVDLSLRGKGILLCTSGEIAISTSKEETVELRRGEACFVEGANYVSILGSGTGYLAMG